MDLDFATTTELCAALHNRTISSRELLEHLIARHDDLNPSLNAIVALDLDRARAAADASDAALARGDDVGPLHGLPMTIKDIWETEGLVTTSGAPELKDHVPATDALAVGRLKAAGAIVFGKTNTPLYAGDLQTFNEVYGRTNNPWDITRCVGGSSGGAAAAVAAGLTSLDLGTDIGGSIRNPAHFNGVYGFKPSWGVVPCRGQIPGPPGCLVETDVNCNGPLARSLDDLKLALDVLAGPIPEDAVGWKLELDAGAPIDDVAGLRVATVFHEGRDVTPIAADVVANLEAFAGRLSAAGASVEAVSMPVPLADGFRSWQDLVIPFIGTDLPDDTYDAFKGLEDVDTDDPVIYMGKAMVCRYRTWANADRKRQHERVAWAACFEDYDVVLAPVMPTAAFPHDTDRSLPERMLDVDGAAIPHLTTMAWCGAIGSALLPVVVVPTGPTASGLPVGVQLIGPFLSDRRLLNIARRIDEAAGPGFTPPPI